MKRFLPYLFIIVCFGCREKYIIPFTSPPSGFLVVEGFINAGPGPTSIKLSRTIGLADSINRKNETLAQVSVEGQDNSNTSLSETEPGLYSIAQLILDDNVQYRLHIKTKDGNDYFSSYEPVLKTPAIDSISWERNGGVNVGVELFVNTHDPLNITKHYRWETEETWEFHAYYFSMLQYVYDTITHKVDTVEDRPIEESNKMYYCWQHENSSRILIGSTVSLNRDSIHLPVQFIPEGSWKLGVLYSIKLNQYAISSEEHEFLRRMKKNTEQVGSLFDAQPSELKGNIYNASNPNEIVIGFVGVTTRQEKRIFISNGQVPNWNYRRYCEQIEIPVTPPDTLDAYRIYTPITIASYHPFTGLPYTIFVADADCSICTLKGTNIKPSFWP